MTIHVDTADLHEFAPGPIGQGKNRQCWFGDSRGRCGLPAEDPIHRTPRPRISADAEAEVERPVRPRLNVPLQAGRWLVEVIAYDDGQMGYSTWRVDTYAPEVDERFDLLRAEDHYFMDDTDSEPTTGDIT